MSMPKCKKCGVKNASGNDNLCNSYRFSAALNGMVEDRKKEESKQKT